MKNLKTKLSLKVKIPTANKNRNDFSQENQQGKKVCNHIIDNIYLSGYFIASDIDYLKKNKFTHLINCAYTSKSFDSKNFNEIEYLNLNLNDDPSFNIIDYFQKFVDYIENIISHKRDNYKILVHCFEGISRGPTMVLAYLIWKFNLSREEAYKIVKDQRRCIDINLGFIFQLDKWSLKCKQNLEKRLFIRKNTRLISKSHYMLSLFDYENFKMSDVKREISSSNNKYSTCYFQKFKL